MIFTLVYLTGIWKDAQSAVVTNYESAIVLDFAVLCDEDDAIANQTNLWENCFGGDQKKMNTDW